MQIVNNCTSNQICHTSFTPAYRIFPRVDVNRLVTSTATRERISIVTQTERFLRCMSLLSNFIGIRSARKNIGEGNKHIPSVVNWYLNTAEAWVWKASCDVTLQPRAFSVRWFPRRRWLSLSQILGLSRVPEVGPTQAKVRPPNFSLFEKALRSSIIFPWEKGPQILGW